jgi:hypothetical protein
MSAAATAAGYLYASGRLRGRAAREQEQESRPEPKKAEPRNEKPKEKIRVAVLQAPEEEKPRRTPKIEYRTRKRWSPE